MISRLTGKLIAKTATEAVIDCNGIGFSAFITLATYDRLPEIGEEVSLITHLIPRDDSLNLYGFYDVVERDAFLQLISISGVGAKTAIAVLSALSVAELQQFIISGNSPALQKLQGIGKKTAERIILELKDKIAKLQVGEEALLPGTISDTVRQEAVMALVSLGYTNTAAEKAVKKVLADVSGDITVESLIRLVLKNTGK